MARVTNEVIIERIEQLTTAFREHCIDEHKFQQQVLESLHGDSCSPGMKGKIQRLEDRAKRADWYIGGLFAFILSSLGVLAEWLRR